VPIYDTHSVGAREDAEPTLLSATFMLNLEWSMTMESIQSPTTVAPGGRQHPFGFGQSLNPYPHHYSAAFASSTILRPLHQQLSSRMACRPPLLMGEAMNRDFLVPCNAERVRMRRD
jgi:hypothetical protein